MSAPAFDESDRIEEEAAAWIWRNERGLTPDERVTLARWLEADPRHRAELARSEGYWNRLHPAHRRVAEEPAGWRAESAWFSRLPLALAAAAVLVFLLWVPRVSLPAPTVSRALPLVKEIEVRTLEDSSVVELNRGAALSVRFTPGERRVELARGEAHFSVAKNPLRPFIVTAGGVSVRAVGTAFDIRLGAQDVSVLVTEGKVQVRTPGQGSGGDATGFTGTPTVKSGERLIVPLSGHSAAPPQAVHLSPEELTGELAWQPRLLTFVGTPLSEIAGEFNRHNPIRLVVDDPELKTFKISARLRSDNIDGFVRLLETGFGIRAERQGANEIVLRKAP